MESNSVGYKLVVRDFTTEQDYDMIKSWWDQHEDDVPPKDYISTKGLIVEVDGMPTCNAFLYRTDSKFCMLQFMVSNPISGKIERDLAITALIRTAKQWAAENKFGIIYASGSKEKYLSKLEDEKFFKVTIPQYHLFYKV